MRMQGTKSWGRWLVLAVVAVGLFMSPAPGDARGNSTGGDVMAYVNRAKGTWYTGVIDAINRKTVSISDVNHKFASDVVFVSRYGFKVSRQSFVKGKKVKMLINSDYKCSILLEL